MSSITSLMGYKQNQYLSTSSILNEISNNVVCATSKVSDQPTHTRSLIRAFATRLIVTLLTERHLEGLSLKGGCTGLSESTLVKKSHCWKSHAMAQLSLKSGHDSQFSLDFKMMQAA